MPDPTTAELFDPDALLALSRRSDPVGVLSIYVDAAPGRDPGPEGAAIDIKNRLAELQRRVASEGPPERARAVAEGVERLGPEIERLTHPAGPGRGRAIFAALGEDHVTRFSSQLHAPNRVVLDSGAFIHPLLELLDEGGPAGVVIASRDDATILEWRLGELTPLERLEPEVSQAPHERSGPVGSSRGAGATTPKREQRAAREREQDHRFVGRVATAASRLARERDWGRVLVSGGDRLTEPLAAALTPPPPEVVVREPRLLAQMEPAGVAAIATERLRAEHDAFESRLVDRARDAALGAGTAALGLSEVVGALNEGRVDHLVYDPEVRYVGSVGGDGLLYAESEVGPAGEDLVAEPRLTERLVERALETGARITPVEGAASAALAEASGIAALLRW